MEDRHPTVTAAVVAATLLLHRDEPELVDVASLPRVEAAVRTALPELGVLLDRVPWPLLSRAARVVERVASPGFSVHYALRKRAVRMGVEAAIAAGHDQVVLLGAGFDMMGHAMTGRATVFEVDHPNSQAKKRRAVGEDGVRYAAVDLLADDLPAKLRAAGVDPRRDAVIAAEGLFMYFDRTRVAGLLDVLAGFFTGRRRLVATFLTPDAAGRVRLHSQRRVVDLVMELLGETFAFGTTVPDLVDLLGRHGWPVTEVASTVAERDHLVPAARGFRAPGEVIVTAAASARAYANGAAVAEMR